VCPQGSSITLTRNSFLQSYHRLLFLYGKFPDAHQYAESEWIELINRDVNPFSLRDFYEVRVLGNKKQWNKMQPRIKVLLSECRAYHEAKCSQYNNLVQDICSSETLVHGGFVAGVVTVVLESVSSYILAHV